MSKFFEKFEARLSTGADVTDGDVEAFEEFVREANPEITIRLVANGVYVEKHEMPLSVSVPVLATSLAGSMYEDMRSLSKESRTDYIYGVFGFILERINRHVDADQASEVLS